MLRNSTVALYCSACPASRPIPSPSARGFPPQWPHRRPVTPTRRSSTCATSDADAPPAWPRSAHPTPYEIFDIHKAAPYTKRRFYQLVKLYHPDTHDSNTRSPLRPAPPLRYSAPFSPHALSPATRLERYRLVVAANNLLSDPEKRRLYDAHGVGWTQGHRVADVRAADRAWRHRPNSPANNATLEDWERWYEARDGRRREPTYMNNGSFAALVIVMCMAGAMMQANRAEASGAHFIESTKQRHAAIGQEMLRSSTTLAGRSKDERVDYFLRDREGVASGSIQGSRDTSQQSDGPA